MPSGVERTGGRVATTPMSERQQLALLMQMTSPKSGSLQWVLNIIFFVIPEQLTLT